MAARPEGCRRKANSFACAAKALYRPIRRFAKQIVLTMDLQCLQCFQHAKANTKQIIGDLLANRAYKGSCFVWAKQSELQGKTQCKALAKGIAL